MKRKHPLAILLACSWATSSSAVACELADPPATQRVIDWISRADFEQAHGVYEGIIVADPDFDSEGRFWVLRSHKGPTKTFELLHLPPDGGCIGALRPSGVLSAGLLSVPSQVAHEDGFNGLMTEERVRSWERQKFVDGFRISLLKVGLLALAVTVAVIGSIMLRRRRSRLANHSKIDSP